MRARAPPRHTKSPRELAAPQRLTAPSTPDTPRQSRSRLRPTTRTVARIKANFPSHQRTLVPVYAALIRSVYSVYLARSPRRTHCCHGVWSNATSHCSNTRPVNAERKEGGRGRGRKMKRAEQSRGDLGYSPVFDWYSCACAR